MSQVVDVRSKLEFWLGHLPGYRRVIDAGGISAASDHYNPGTQ